MTVDCIVGSVARAGAAEYLVLFLVGEVGWPSIAALSMDSVEVRLNVQSKARKPASQRNQPKTRPTSACAPSLKYRWHKMTEKIEGDVFFKPEDIHWFSRRTILRSTRRRTADRTIQPTPSPPPANPNRVKANWVIQIQIGGSTQVKVACIGRRAEDPPQSGVRVNGYDTYVLELPRAILALIRLLPVQEVRQRWHAAFTWWCTLCWEMVGSRTALKVSHVEQNRTVS